MGKTSRETGPLTSCGGVRLYEDSHPKRTLALSSTRTTLACLLASKLFTMMDKMQVDLRLPQRALPSAQDARLVATAEAPTENNRLPLLLAEICKNIWLHKIEIIHITSMSGEGYFQEDERRNNYENRMVERNLQMNILYRTIRRTRS